MYGGFNGSCCLETTVCNMHFTLTEVALKLNRNSWVECRHIQEKKIFGSYRRSDYIIQWSLLSLNFMNHFLPECNHIPCIQCLNYKKRLGRAQLQSGTVMEEAAWEWEGCVCSSLPCHSTTVLFHQQSRKGMGLRVAWFFLRIVYFHLGRVNPGKRFPVTTAHQQDRNLPACSH